LNNRSYNGLLFSPKEEEIQKQ